MIGEGSRTAVRLEGETEQADRLEPPSAVQERAAAAPMAPAPPLVDETRLADLNRTWDILEDRGWLRRIRRSIGRLLSPGLARQRAFNSALVDHLNRNAAAERESHHLAQVAMFQTALSRLTDDWLKTWQSLGARELRYDARTAALTKSYDDLRETVAILQQATLTLKREMERLQSVGTPSAPSTAGAGPAGAPTPAEPAAPTDLNSFIYVGFQDRFRGSRDEIRARLLDYIPLFAGASDVLDLGCGRGELLDLFRQHGINARGIDTNHEMVEVCRWRGLDVERADAVSFLESRPDASLGGLVAIQVVEHLEPGYLMRLIEAASQKLRPGGVMVLETINPACWVAFFDSYLRDLTHVRPLHPDTLRYLVQTCAFSQVDVRYSVPIRDEDRLQRVRLPSATPGYTPDVALVDLMDAVNANADRLNARLFTYMDYAIVARR